MKRRTHDRRKRKRRHDRIGGMTDAVQFLVELLADILLSMME